MKKLLHFYDNYALKIGIAFLIIFTALYPKLPSVHIIRTWVYIRLEDFFILAIVILWIIQLLRRKINLPIAVSIPIAVYWLIGFLLLIFSIIYIGPYLTNFFPHVAAFNYFRRIEYMILFFVALSTVRSIKDVRDYTIILSLTTLGVVLYGFGQRFYLDLWTRFPAFFQQNSFCFPSFQTGNEEFAKGMPLCLQKAARLTSTFGGHYDLAAYLVLVIPILLTVALSVKKLSIRILTFLLFLGNLILLIFTSSRISFISYLAAVIFALIFYKKKLFIIPIIIISVVLLVIFSESTAKRLLATFRLSSVVTNMQGQLIGLAPANLSPELQKKLNENQTQTQLQTLPFGSGYLGLPQKAVPVATSVAVVNKTLTPEEIRRLKLQSGSLELSTISGSFLIRKVLVYDISFTTRFQAEWPNAWNAFLRNPVLGSGYSTITLATDNDYFRALGETGLLGLLSFLSIFLILGITLKEISPSINKPLIKAFVFGLAGGTIGLMINAMLIDVFEASKVAENLWILLGIGTGGLLLFKKKTVPYWQILKKVFTSNIFISIYLFVLILTVYLGSINNFFVADDFTLLREGASSSTGDFVKYFTDSQNNIYAPIAKIIVFLLYTLFSFQPQGYHVFILFLHFAATLGVFFLAQKLLKKRLLAFLSALVFLVYPVSGTFIFWFSTISVTLATIFCIYALISFIKFKESKSRTAYIFTFIFAVFAFLSHELSLILPFLLIACDLFLFKQKRISRRLLIYLPFFILIPIYLIILYLTHASPYIPHLSLVYPASIGLSIITIVILDIISNFLTKNRGSMSTLPLIVLTIVILIASYIEIQKQNNTWQKDGNITKNILTDLRVDYEGFSKSTNVYFVNVPIQTGLADSLWFIYQNNNPVVHQASSVDEAKMHILNNNKVDNYIFIIQKDGRIKEAE